MIKKQYNRFDFGSYFNNFVAHHNATANSNEFIKDALKPYKATVAKSKNRHAKLNVKWHDPRQYMLFILMWS
jgi:hypothetical protein